MLKNSFYLNSYVSQLTEETEITFNDSVLNISDGLDGLVVVVVDVFEAEPLQKLSHRVQINNIGDMREQSLLLLLISTRPKVRLLSVRQEGCLGPSAGEKPSVSILALYFRNSLLLMKYLT